MTSEVDTLEGLGRKVRLVPGTHEPELGPDVLTTLGPDNGPWSMEAVRGSLGRKAFDLEGMSEGKNR